MSEKDVMNTVDAAVYLGIHAETLRRLARCNEIPCFKVGRDWRFRKEALVSWADDQRSGGTDTSVGTAIVVDDEERICTTVANMLRRLGCRARTATSGAMGLRLLAEETPDFVVLDLKMPNMSGPVFLGELRKQHPLLPVVVITGYPESDLVAQAMQHAPFVLLAKPVELELLERTIRVVLGERSRVATG